MSTPKKIIALAHAEAGSQMQTDFQRDQGLAEKYLAEADSKNLYDLYQRRCIQLNEFGSALMTVAEIHSGKTLPPMERTAPDAIASMERVALAAIELAKAFSGKGDRK